nr:MAG TPA: hypothetical protein [Caudoviricetes sp.]
MPKNIKNNIPFWYRFFIFVAKFKILIPGM